MSEAFFDLEWLERTLDYPEETATFASVKAVVAGRILTRSISSRRNTRRDRVHVPTHPLALGIAQNWWALLHETDRGLPATRDAFRARHRLDAYLSGFLFPPMALWSVGSGALAVATPAMDDPAQSAPLAFLERLPDRSFLPRFEIEAALSDLIEATLERPGLLGGCGETLREAWGRVRDSFSDPSERAYCESAGRLGFDPYDPDGPDLTVLAAPLPESLFADVCEASTIPELGTAVESAATQRLHLRDAPTVDVEAFAEPPPQDLTRMAAFDGYEAARLLRRRLSLDDDPRIAVRRLLGPAADRDPILLPSRVPVIEGVVARDSGQMRAVVAARTRGQHRFRLCRAAYLAWTSRQHVELGITVARTRSQQASRTFGAELIAPAAYLRERAGAHGLTSDDIFDLAAELECDPQVVLDQAENHDIGLR